MDFLLQCSNNSVNEKKKHEDLYNLICMSLETILSLRLSDTECFQTNNCIEYLTEWT